MRDPAGGRQRAAAHDAGLLELAQPLRQDVRAQVRHAGAQIGEPLRPEQQLAHDEQRPPLPDHVEGACDPARIAVGSLAGHLPNYHLTVGMTNSMVGFSNYAI